MSPVSVLFLKNSALMLLVFDHWNKENEMVSGFPVPKVSLEVNYEVLGVSLTLQFFHRVCSLLWSRTNLKFLSRVKNSDVFRVRQAT